MAKKVKKNVKKKKKKISFAKRLFKTIGICMASVFGFLGLSMGVYALFGGFNPKVVNLEGMNFEKAAYVLSGSPDGTGKVFVGRKELDGSIFEIVKLLPTNEDATKLDVILSGGSSIVSYEEGNKVGSPLKFEIKQNKVGYKNAEYSYNKSGEFVLKAVQEEDQRVAETKIFIESAVQGFDFKTTNSQGEFDSRVTKIYPGNNFTVSVANIFPQNALNKPLNCDDPSNEFYQVYGENYFNKQILYYSSDKNVAEVDEKTGEITVHAEGSFDITCYIAKTYKDNAELPKKEDCASDSEYFTLLAKKTIAQKISFTSNPIEVSGISATTSTIENLMVFDSYKYSVNGLYAPGENELNLKLALKAPQGSTFEDSQLAYKLKDVEILEGVKKNNKFYITSGQTLSEDGLLLTSNYFTIRKSLNPLTWTIRVEDYTTQDLYLIARISNVKLTNDELSMIESDGLEAVEENGENWVYYAFIKVKPEIVSSEGSISFENNRVMAQFDTKNNILYLTKNKMLDVSELLKNEKTTQTYNKVKYFVSKGADLIDHKEFNDDGNPEVQFYSSRVTIDANNNPDGLEYYADDFGKYIRITDASSLGTSDEIEIYGAMFKYKFAINNNGEYEYETNEDNEFVLDENGNKILKAKYSFIEESKKYLNKLDSSNKLLITISKDINFEDFTFVKELSSDKKAIISKGEKLEISFKTANLPGLIKAYNEKLFKVVCSSSVDNLVSSEYVFDDANAVKVLLTGVTEGTGIIKLMFNGEYIDFGGFTEIELTVQNNDVKSISIFTDSEGKNNLRTNEGNKIEFKVSVVNSAFNFQAFGRGEPNNNLWLYLKVEGGNENTQLKIASLSSDLVVTEVNSLSETITNPTGKAQIVIPKNFVKETDVNGILGTRFIIYPNKLCQNLKFYVYTVVDGGVEVKSDEITISVTDDGFNVVENKNSNNSITINGIEYEKVIGGEQFTMVNTGDQTNINGFISVEGNNKNFKNAVSKYFGKYAEITTESDGVTSLYDVQNQIFNQVTENTICTIVFKPSFWSEDMYKTFYFYILPKHYVRTDSLIVNAGDTKTLDEIKSCVTLIERNYGNVGQSGAYQKDIEETQISETGNYTIEFYKNNSFKDEDKLTEYTAPNAFLGDNELIYFKLTLNQADAENKKEITGSINVQVNSTTSLEQVLGTKSSLICNGQSVKLAELFKIVKTLTGEVSGEITSVKLTKTSYQKLIGINGVVLKDADGNVISGISEISNVTEIYFPESLNVYSIDGLYCDVTSDGKTKTNHEFSLNFKLIQITLNESSNCYLFKNEITALAGDDQTEKDKIKNMLISNYVVSAQESAESYQEGPRDIKDSVEVAILEGLNQIEFRIKINENNYISKTLNLSVVPDISVKTSTTFIVGKAYEVQDLISLDDFGVETNITTSDITFESVESDGEYNASKYIIQSNNTILVAKTGTNDETVGDLIKFNILGRTVEIKGFIFKEIKILDSLEKIYSNNSYKLFDENTVNLIKENSVAGSKNAIKVEISTNNNNVWVKQNLDGSFSGEIEVGSYDGNETAVNIKVVINSGDFEGTVINKQLQLHSLVINPKYDQNTYNGNQVLVKGFAYNLQDYFEIVTSDTDLLTSLKYSILINNIENNLNSGDLTNFVPNVDEGIITLIIKLNNKELKRINFYNKVYTISSSLNENIFYVNQVLSHAQLKSLINVLDVSGNLCEDEEILNKLQFFIDNVEITSSLTLNANNVLVVKLGNIIQQSFNIEAVQAKFECNSVYTAYSDTKVSNYVSCYVEKNDATKLNLVLNYMFSNSSDVVKSSSDLILSRDGYQIAKLNTLNGELSIYSDIENVANKTIKVLAYISGTDPLAEDSLTKIEITFNCTNAQKVVSSSVIDLYVGDQDYDLSQHAYFTLNGTKALPEFEVDSIIDSQNLGYVFSENSVTKEIHISKNGQTYAKLKQNSNGSRTILQTTSSLDSLTLVVHGFVKVNSSSYTLESLRTNFIELEINIININVDFGTFVKSDETEEKLSQILVDDETYYVLDSQTGYGISPKITNGKTRLALTDLKFEGINFIGKVNEEIALSFVKKLQNLSLKNNSTLTLPNGNGEISISKASNEFNFTINKTLVDYVFVTLNYSIGLYNGNVKLCLKPDLNISFEYASETVNYANVYAPSAYRLSQSGNLFSFNKELLTGSKIATDNVTYNFKFEFSKVLRNASNTNVESLDYSAGATRNHNLNVSENISTGYNLTITSKKSEGSDDNYYCVKIILTDESNTNNSYSYYYYIKVLDITVRTFDNNGNEITSENPYVVKNSNNLNLKDFIFVNSVSSSVSVGDDYYDNITFSFTDNEIYTLTKDGIFTPKIDAFNMVNIEFNLFNITYSIFLKGQELSAKFLQDGTEISDNYNFINGDSYYVYLSSETVESGKVISVDVRSEQDSLGDDSILLNLLIKSYTFAGITYTDSSAFDESINQNKKTYSFMGNNLIVLTKLDDCYFLEISAELNGDLIFTLSPVYAQMEAAKNCVVSSDVEISINYVNPSVVETKNYQNVLSESNFDLNSIVKLKGQNLGENSTLNFEIEESSISQLELNSLLNLNNGIMYLQSAKTEVYLKIKVTFKKLVNFVNVRIIPKTKGYTLGGGISFYCLKNEVVDLTNYIKIDSFSGFDSKNEPIYVLMDSFKEVTGGSETLVQDPRNYNVGNGEKTIVINNVTYTFKTLDLTFDKVETFVGEVVDLKSLVQNNIRSSNLTDKNARIKFEKTDLVSEEGTFSSTNLLSDFDIKFLVNDKEFSIKVDCNDLSINTTDRKSILKEDTSTNQTIRYENIYAGQEINFKDFITTSNESEFTKIQIEFLKIESVSDKTGRSYDNSKFSVISSNICGKNSLVLSNDGVVLFAIGQNKIICYSSLNYEVLIKMELSLEGNTTVSSNFNVRLLPVEIKYSLEKSINNENLVNGKYSIYDIFYVETKAVNQNINLNNEVKFYINSVTTENLINNAWLDSSKLSSETALIANFAGQNYQLKLLYTNSGESKSSLFKEVLTNESSCLQSSDDAVSIIGVGDVYDSFGELVSGINYNIVVENGAIYYYVYDNDSNLLCKIDTNGLVTNRANKNFSLTLYAKTEQVFDMKEYNSTASSQIELKPESLVNAKWEKDNGVYVLSMLAGSEIDLEGFLNGSSLLDNENNSNFLETVVKKSDKGNYFVKSENVQEITYGYFYIYKNDESLKVLVKVYPYNLYKVQEDDFTYNGASIVVGTKTAIEKGDSFTSIYVSENSEINLDEYVLSVTKSGLKSNVTYNINKVVCYNLSSSNYSFASETLENEYQDYSKLTDNKLEIHANGTYYVYLNAKTQNTSIDFAFRVLQVKNNTISTIDVENNSYINLNSLINVIAICADSSFSGGANINLLNNLDFYLTNQYNSYISSNVLYVLEKDEGNNNLVLHYNLDNVVSENVIISVSKKSKTYGDNNYPYFVKDGEMFEERWGDAENVTHISENISKIDSVKVGDVNYLTTIESNPFKFNDVTLNNSKNAQYFIVEKMLIIFKDNVTGENGNGASISFRSGDVLFYDSVSEQYKLENNIGVIELFTTIGENSSDCNYFVKQNYKLNNYAITKSASGYEYFVNGEKVENMLKFDLMMQNTDGEFVNSVTIDGETYTISNDGDTIIANGIRLTTDGQISGTKTNSTIKMFVKAYVINSNLEISENFALFEI